MTLVRMRYPHAEWLPWKPISPAGQPTNYAGRNTPAAVVLHVMQGYQRVARQWAEAGHFGASWHYSVGRDGEVLQHLDHADGGYHAGITAEKARLHPPTWPLRRGTAVNVNHYTIGVEHEGFAGAQFTLPQAEASRRLCRWLARELRIPFDRDHFAPHAAVDPRDRAHDFNTPALRDEFYAYLFAKDETVDTLVADLRNLEARIDRTERLVGANGIEHGGERLRGEVALASLDSRGISLALSVDRLNTAMHEHIAKGHATT